MTQRLEIIDALRGLASLAVCWFHMTKWYPDGSLVKLSGSYGWLGVEVFFVISGFIIPFALHRGNYKVNKNWHIFIQKRIIRIDPPYLVMAIISALLTYLATLAPGYQGVDPDFSITQFLLHLGYLNAIFDYRWLNPVFWTLAIEFQFYLLISILFPILISTNRIFRTFGIISLCSLAFIFPSRDFVFLYLCLFAVGIVTFQYFANIIRIREYLFILTLTSLLLIQSLELTIAIPGILTALAIAFVRIPQIRVFQFLGAISYSLYLVHTPIGERVVSLGRRVTTTEFENLLVSICGLLLSICAAFIFYKYIEKPAQEWSSRIKYHKNNT
ncbi:MAG: acyltransferase [Methylococcales bacterium]